MGMEPRPYMFLDGEQQLKMAEPAELRALGKLVSCPDGLVPRRSGHETMGKLGTEDAERVSVNNLQNSLSRLLDDALYCVYSFQLSTG